jgi:ATPase subunit of ABC transporter with duplicated ATPase domains
VPATLVASDVTVVRGPTLVLSGVSLTVAPGSRIGVVGPNGAGKSTLLATLAGRAGPGQRLGQPGPRTATVGLLPPGAGPPPGRDAAGLPRPPDRA